MAVTPDLDFTLAQKINPSNDMTLASQAMLLDSTLFPDSLLSINDTVLETIELNENVERCETEGISETNDNECCRNNDAVDNRGKSDGQREDVNSSSETTRLPIDRSPWFDDDIALTLKRKTAAARKELEDIFDSSEISICRNHPMNNTTNVGDFDIKKSEWEDDSLLDQVFNDMESLKYKQVDNQSTNNKLAPNLLDAHLPKAPSIPSTPPTIRKLDRLSSPKQIDSSKRRRTDITSSAAVWKENFYGLPNYVKGLIQSVKGIQELYEWQDECLRLKAIYDRKNLIYALPTSGGKTLVAEILMLKELVINRKNAIFILPFVAIVQEKVRSLAPFALALNFLVEEYAAGNGKYPPRKRRRKRTIYVCTIEKGLGLVNSLIETNRLDEVGMMVIDELHLLGENGGRGATLEGLLTKVMCCKTNLHIIGMSATIGNLNDIAKFLNAEVYTKNFRPVELKEYVKCLDDIWLVDLKEEEILTDPKKIKYSYSKQAINLDPDRLGGLVMDIVPQDSCLVFCPSRKNSENVAVLLTKVLFKTLHDHKRKEKEILLRALTAEGALCEILAKTIMFGVAYHHSGLMSEERRLLEEAFRSGTLCVICCTSTLAAGVNLPARRVILRHPYVGNQFLNLSRYKQMIGRAGRAGMKDVGESILICRPEEIPKVKQLLTSKMDDCISTIHVEEDRGMNNLVLSSILLELATTRSELHIVTEGTLLGIQEKKLNVSTKKITDRTIRSLMKAGAIKIKEIQSDNKFDPNFSVLIPTQDNNQNKTQIQQTRNGKRTVKLNSTTKLEVSKLGRAAMKGCVELSRAHMLYQDLVVAQSQLVLLDCLHLLYLVTPYDFVDQVKPLGNIYCDVVCSLSRVQMETARVLGINETVATKLRTGVMPKGIDARVINRFYLTLMLNELWNQQTVHIVSLKYQVNRGIVQNLMNASASFASCVERFCAELDEFWAFRDLLHSFGTRLSHCCAVELEPLMELPSVKLARASQLFNAGYKTLQSVALADPKEICDMIENMPLRIAFQIVAAAKLILLEKVENLRDEAAEVLEGIDLSNF